MEAPARGPRPCVRGPETHSNGPRAAHLTGMCGREPRGQSSGSGGGRRGCPGPAGDGPVLLWCQRSVIQGNSARLFSAFPTDSGNESLTGASVRGWPGAHDSEPHVPGPMSSQLHLRGLSQTSVFTSTLTATAREPTSSRFPSQTTEDPSQPHLHLQFSLHSAPQAAPQPTPPPRSGLRQAVCPADPSSSP